MTVVVWLLMYVAVGGTSVQVGTVDNIASRDNCEALATLMKRDGAVYRTTCIAVRKAAQ